MHAILKVGTNTGFEGNSENMGGLSNDAIVLIAWTSGGANNEDGENEDKSRNASFSRTESELV